jgi:hypothetical protein
MINIVLEPDNIMGEISQILMCKIRESGPPDRLARELRQGKGFTRFLEQRNFLTKRLLSRLKEKKISSFPFGTPRPFLKQYMKVSTLNTVEELISLVSRIEEDQDTLQIKGKQITARSKHPLIQHCLINMIALNEEPSINPWRCQSTGSIWNILKF